MKIFFNSLAKRERERQVDRRCNCLSAGSFYSKNRGFETVR